jgi:hypothetical protein
LSRASGTQNATDATGPFHTESNCMTPTPTCIRHLEAELTFDQVSSIMAVMNVAWPRVGWSAEQLAEEFMETRRLRANGSGAGLPPIMHHVVWIDGGAVAHSKSFPRMVVANTGELLAMGLAGVCVAPDRRLEGFGAAAARDALGRVDDGTFVAALFQTKAPGFYEKIGARRTTNTFVNSLNRENPQANPWWDDAVMVYDPGLRWPGGTVDMKGPGF